MLITFPSNTNFHTTLWLPVPKQTEFSLSPVWDHNVKFCLPKGVLYLGSSTQWSNFPTFELMGEICGEFLWYQSEIFRQYKKQRWAMSKIQIAFTVTWLDENIGGPTKPCKFNMKIFMLDVSSNDTISSKRKTCSSNGAYAQWILMFFVVLLLLGKTGKKL